MKNKIVKKENRNGRAARIALISVAIMLIASFAFSAVGCKKNKYDAATPSGFSTFTKKTNKLASGDFYVSKSGLDSNDGSKKAPFATIEKARDTVRGLKNEGALPRGGVTVSIMKGNYNTRGIVFDEQDSGTADAPIKYVAYGDGEVSLNGGVTLSKKDFSKLDSAQSSRLTKGAKDNVVQVDLKKYNLSRDDYGKIYATGKSSTASKYDGEHVGASACELFIGGQRSTLARYPNAEYSKLGKVVDNGYAYEAPIGTYHEEWNTARNPRGGTFEVDSAMSKRIKSWQSLDDVWAYGYFYWDWSDMSTPIKSFDSGKNTLTTEFCSPYGFKKSADYYVFNVFEELDAPGEYYIDRSSSVLYVYADKNFKEKEIALSIATDSLIQIKSGCNFLTFEGLNIENGRKNAIEIAGNNTKITDCTITNFAENGIVVGQAGSENDANYGKNNIIERNEISATGQCGIVLSGGDRKKLESANNIADNNYIHNIAEIYKTYKAAIDISGVGNTASHNEITNTPHMAIYYAGNRHIIEYNNIHDVVLTSTDAGAIYAGRSLDYYGCEIRYNAIYNIGSDKFEPDAIYFDDALAGQSAYGNLIVNVPKNGILIGGGRDNAVFDNLIINAKTPITYDDRAYEGFNNNGWYHSKVATLTSPFWILLAEAQALNTLWGNAYPLIGEMTNNFAKATESTFAVNPSGALVKNNICLSKKAKLGSIAKSVVKFGQISGNIENKLADVGFTNFKKGNYTFNKNFIEKNPNAFNIPVDKIGQY